jgi:SAM-dependent methyltransferase
MSNKFKHQLTYTKFPQSLYHGDKIKFVNQCLENFGKGRKILDIGCGAVPYQSPGNDVFSMDADEAIVKDLWKMGCQQVFLGDANKKIPFENETFDTVLLLDVIEHFYEPEKATSEVKRVLKRNGHVLIFTPNFSSPLYMLVEKLYFPLVCHYHTEKYSEHVFNNKPDDLRSYLKKHFVVEELRLCSYGMAVFVACRKE